ncbi:unnamed protein product [Lampetra fluviatilis]
MADMNASFSAGPPLGAKLEPQQQPPPAAAAEVARGEEEGGSSGGPPRPAPAELPPPEPAQTLVFVDAETTGLPESRPRATELCFIAVDRRGLSVATRTDEGVPLPPRVHDKLTVRQLPPSPARPPLKRAEIKTAWRHGVGVITSAVTTVVIGTNTRGSRPNSFGRVSGSIGPCVGNIFAQITYMIFCMEPNKVVDAEAGRLTGLTNDILAQNRRRPFDARAARLVLDFLARQAPPVCLVAHNGIQFDFPLLKVRLLPAVTNSVTSTVTITNIDTSTNTDTVNIANIDTITNTVTIANIDTVIVTNIDTVTITDELSSVGETLPPGTLCADTLPAMRQIMAHNSPWPTPELAQPPPGEHSRKRKLLARGRGRGRGRGYANDYGYEDPNSHRKVAFGKKNKFRLGDIYVQFFGHEPPVGLHNAETDTMALLSIAQHCAPQLLAWMDQNARPIADVQPLYQPAPPKDGAKKEEGEEDDDVIVLLPGTLDPGYEAHGLLGSRRAAADQRDNCYAKRPAGRAAEHRWRERLCKVMGAAERQRRDRLYVD